MSFGGFGSSNVPASGGFGGFGANGSGAGFNASTTASPFGGAPTTSGFGLGTSTFGAGAVKPAFGGFGAAAPTTGSTFGAQPSTSTGFGGFGTSAPPQTGFGATANPATTSGFGASSAYGGGTTTGGFGISGKSAFGATSPFGAKPATSPSPFGSTSAFGGGAGTPSAFGGGATTGGFSTPAPAGGSMFGSTTGGFGASFAKSPFVAAPTPSIGGFGSHATGTTGSGFGYFGSQPATGVATGQVQVGTGQPAYQPTREVEPSGTGGTANYISISRMPAYAHKSTEELRYEDYLKRTNPASAQAAAVQNVPVSAPTATGVTGAFGGFGTQTSTPSAFGSTSNFGSSQPSGFGAPSTGGFGSSGFGSSTIPAASSGFGAFGSQSTAAAPSGSLFGNNTAAVTGSSTFGAPASSGVFGAASNATSAFGAPATGSGFGSTTGAFGSTFGAAPPAQTGGFGGFGTTPTAASSFGASAFGKPATSGAFGGFGANAASAATPAAGGFGLGVVQPQSGMSNSLFGGASASTPASTGFSFGATASKPPASGGFSFGSNSGAGAFGSTPGSAFGAPAAPSAFGTTPAQSMLGSTSQFGSIGGATAPSGSFGFGTTPSAAPGGTSNLFGAAKPASTSLFGSTTGSATNGGFFGNTLGTGSSSLFGGANPSTGASGFGFNSGSSFGNTGASGFGGFGTLTTPAAQTGVYQTTGNLFGQPQQQLQPVAAQPQNLVAAPDSNPYGAGLFGAGLVEQNVKAALDLRSIKSDSSAFSRFTTLADDVGLSRGPFEPALVTRRQTLSNRHAIPVSFVRGSFKGSKNRLSTFASSALLSASSHRSLSGQDANGDKSSKENEFKFTSSLFRNSTTKKLVIDKSELSSIRDNGTNSRVSIVPITENDLADVREIESCRTRLLKPGDDGKYSVTFCNQTNKKLFSLLLYPHQTVKQARACVKQLLRESSGLTTSSIADIELVFKGRIVHDTSTFEKLQLKEGDSIDVVVIEDCPIEKDRADQSAPSSFTTIDAQPCRQVASSKQFMTYDEYLAASSRDEDSKETQENVNNTLVAPASSSCPALKNKDYYTRPSYESLQAMTDCELSEVEMFSVGCRGLGAVEWIGKTDVRNLDLDELIHFEKKEVVVYQDDEKKHDVGNGLNKPAIVELLGIFPPRRSTSPEQYKERVKQRTEDIGATFLDYSIEKGIWRFRVEHFSRYGFNDDDDDTDMGGPNASSTTLVRIDQLSQEPGLKRGTIKNRSKKPLLARHSDIFRQSGIFAGQSNSNIAVVSFGDGQTSSTVSNKLIEKQNHPERAEAFLESRVDFCAEEEAKPANDDFPVCEVFSVIPNTLKPLGFESKEQLQSGEKSTTYQMMLQASKRGQENAVRNQIDGGMFMARSFRCSWGPNGELVNLGKLTTRFENTTNVASQRCRVCVEFPLRLYEKVKSDLHDGLKLHYEFTSRERNSDDFIDRDGLEIPAQFSLPGRDPLLNYINLYVAYAENLSRERPSEKRILVLWKLVQALWGQEHVIKMEGHPDTAFSLLASRDHPIALENFNTFQIIDIRREAISQWFEAAIQLTENVVISGDTPSLQGVLCLLCQHRVVEASEMAIECGDVRLATLIAQAASYESDGFRSLMETQMAQWSENGSLEYMDKTFVLIYSVLAGSVEVLTAHKGSSMSWIACLALFMWYKRGPAMPLKTAITLYENAVGKQQATSSRSLCQTAATDKNDLLMELLKLNCEDVASLCKVLSPSGLMSQNSNYLDYEMSWHLQSVLLALGYKLDREWESHIHQNFIRQLEGAGLWEDAVYVALNIADVIERENTCRELLLRNADVLKSDSSNQKKFCKRLSLPPEWISEALAVRAVTKQEHHEEIAYWVAAHRYEEAHASLISHVAMSYLFSNEKHSLMQLLVELEPMAMYIPQWKSCESVDTIGGGLLLEYIRLDLQKGLEVGLEERFSQRVMLILQQLSSARDASAHNISSKVEKNVVLAQTCVSSMIVSLATKAIQLRSLLSYGQESDTTSDIFSTSKPLELEPEFLNVLSHLVTGRETSFVESFRTTQLMHLCSTFIDWRV
ncbi:hypothetical protein CCR75_009748 [Bremia lactucae]|uniref:Nuclear pore complex protein Nup98-Nup96 n=1 Tax=Bremia lactucae TaxID=4779 RepID=A0A976IGW2_BRELC|nr:hypothetical protein CCR75_009748 [Bremia lactucae]